MQELPFTGCDVRTAYDVHSDTGRGYLEAASLVNISGPPDVLEPDVLWDFNGATVLGSCEEVPFDPQDFEINVEMMQAGETEGYVFALKDVDTDSTVFAVWSGSDGIAVEYTNAGVNRNLPSSDTSALAFPSEASINDGLYHVVRAVGSADDFRLYVDGVLYDTGRRRARPLRFPLACTDCLLTMGGHGTVTPDRSLAPDRSSVFVGEMHHLVIRSPD